MTPASPGEQDSPRLFGALDLDDSAQESSLLDLVDHLIDKGCVLNGSILLGLADIDLIHVDLSLLICAAERVEAEERRRGAPPPPPPASVNGHDEAAR